VKVKRTNNVKFKPRFIKSVENEQKRKILTKIKALSLKTVLGPNTSSQGVWKPRANRIDSRYQQKPQSLLNPQTT